jgi:hypothetical protein
VWKRASGAFVLGSLLARSLTLRFSVFPEASPPRALIYDLSIKEINHVCARVFITLTIAEKRKVRETKAKASGARKERKM